MIEKKYLEQLIQLASHLEQEGCKDEAHVLTNFVKLAAGPDAEGPDYLEAYEGHPEVEVIIDGATRVTGLVTDVEDLGRIKVYTIIDAVAGLKLKIEVPKEDEELKGKDIEELLNPDDLPQLE